MTRVSFFIIRLLIPTLIRILRSNLIHTLCDFSVFSLMYKYIILLNCLVENASGICSKRLYSYMIFPVDFFPSKYVNHDWQTYVLDHSTLKCFMSWCLVLGSPLFSPKFWARFDIHMNWFSASLMSNRPWRLAAGRRQRHHLPNTPPDFHTKANFKKDHVWNWVLWSEFFSDSDFKIHRY